MITGAVVKGVELPLPALGAGGRGVQLSVVGGSSGESPLRGSLQQYNPSNGNWQEIRSVMSGSGGTLSVDVAGGIPAGVPLKFVVTMDAGSYLHLGQMSYGEYATGEVPNAGVNSSAFASATNLNLAPLPEDVSVDAGADYVYLHAGNGVEVPMGLEMSLPVVSNGATGASLSFGVDNGGGEAVASLQAQVNGTWQELSSSLVVAGGTAQLEVLDWGLPAGTPLKVVAFTNAGVDMGVIELVYYTVTKAVQTYMALSCDTDNVWNDSYRWSFNGGLRDDDVAGKSNNLDLGARRYDVRLGVLNWSTDPYEAKFPGQSTYSFAGGNPIRNIDKKGNYKVAADREAAYNKSYPMLMTYIKEQIQTDVLNSPKIIQGFQDLRKDVEGFDAKEYLRGVTKWGSGPEVVFGTDFNAPGHYRRETDQIELGTTQALAIEKILASSASSEEKAIAFQRFYQTILHETGHRTDFPDEQIGNPNVGPGEERRYNGGVEAGYKLEESIWGTDRYKPSTTYEKQKFDPNLKNNTIYDEGTAREVYIKLKSERGNGGCFPSVPQKNSKP